jgi:hypothetical protein
VSLLREVKAMAHCTNCGHELREGEKFCAECGTPASGQAATYVQATPTQWEYCEIFFDEGRTSWWRGAGIDSFFYAEGRRGDDTYIIARSPTFKSGFEAVLGGTVTVPPKSSRHQFDRLVRELVSGGWELMNDRAGRSWWRVKFHRQVKR